MLLYHQRARGDIDFERKSPMDETMTVDNKAKNENRTDTRAKGETQDPQDGRAGDCICQFSPGMARIESRWH